ncbi:MAG: response regulator [Desulfobacterales bacterium]|nr:response regulator [Desulfobacterales bacterium]MDD4072482.1 response regulator [Desulfobacterales bacterium]MDD4392567.1 response regulator [Desulfobacterales bacterium]
MAPMDNQQALVLIVDDNPTNIDLLVNTLQSDYRLGIAKDGVKALAYSATYLPDLILLDIMMPVMNGYEVCSRLKNTVETRDIPVIFITALIETDQKTRGFEVGAVDYITKPFHAGEVRARVKTHLSLKQMRETLNAQNIILEQKVEEKTTQLREMLYSTIRTMALTLEIRDPYTAGHQQRVAQLACTIARKLDYSEEKINAIRFAGLLHDIGKIRIPVSILNRPGELLDAEFMLIRMHPETGYEILKHIPAPWPLADIVLQHHERLDGSGYPKGLKSDQILPEAKIVSVADVMEAESSYRPYRPAKGIEYALEEITKNRGILYDPNAVDACVNLFRNENFKFETDEKSTPTPGNEHPEIT